MSSFFRSSSRLLAKAKSSRRGSSPITIETRRNFLSGRSLRIEPLEDRWMLSGVTIITHGFNDNVNGWVTEMAETIANQIAANCQCSVSDVAEMRLTVQSDLSVIPQWIVEPNLKTSKCAETIVLLDWSAVAGTWSPLHPTNFLDISHHTADVANAVVSYLVQGMVCTDPLFALVYPLAENPIHLIGHSRGGSLVTELAKDLGQHGVWVDQVTTLDPVALAGENALSASANVAFFDNYYETSDSSISSLRSVLGENATVTGALNKQLADLPGGYGGMAGDHNDVHLWYQGTIDTTVQTVNDTSGGIFDAVNDGWYGGSNPSRTTSGYNLSRVAGYEHTLSSSFKSYKNEGIWANIGYLDLSATTVSQEGTFSIDCYYDVPQGKSAAISFYLDDNENPYDAPVECLGAYSNRTTSVVTKGSFNDLALAGAALGTYNVYAKIECNGYVRYFYATDKLTVAKTDRTVKIDDVSIAEGNGTTSMTFTVTMSQASPYDVVVEYTTADGTATNGSDYVSSTSAVVITHGQTSANITIQLKGDAVEEPDEYFYVILTRATGATIADAAAKGWIRNDDAGVQPTVNINDVTHSEGDNGTTRYDFVVSLTHAATTEVQIRCWTSDGTANAEDGDYTAFKNYQFYINPGETEFTIPVYVNGDTDRENDESFSVDILVVEGADQNKVTGRGIIENDDDLPSLAIQDVSIDEGAGEAVFTVVLSQPSTRNVSADYITRDGSAQTIAGDYACASGTLTIQAGQTTGQISVTLFDDDKWETDENFYIDLSNAKGAVISQSVGKATIQNDDSAYGTLSINNGANLTSSLIVTLNSLGVVGVSGATGMWISNGSDEGSPAKWYDLQSAIDSWNLAEYGGNRNEGQKWVYTRYCNDNGDVLATASDSILYDAIAPDTPTCLSPQDDATDVSLTPTLTASAFFDADGNAHQATRWQIATDTSFTNVIWDSTDGGSGNSNSVIWDFTDTDSDKTSQTVPSETLSNSTQYFWRVRYQNSCGDWSDWADCRTFTTAANQTPSILIITPTGTQCRNIAINYTLTDMESNACNILAEYSIDGGANWNMATAGPNGDGTTGLTSSPGGTPHTFIWASAADLVDSDCNNVKFRITRTDSAAGTTAVTDAFRVNNVSLTVALARASNQPISASKSPLYFTIVFSEAVTGFSAEDITINGGTGATVLSLTQVSDTVYTLVVSGMTSDGYVTPVIAAGTVTDSEGNANQASDSSDAAVLYDHTAPTVTLSVARLVNFSKLSGSGTATDSGSGVADGTTAYLDIDTNNDGDFTDAGDIRSYVVGVLSGGKLAVTTPWSIPDGTYRLRTRVSDAAGNEGVSATSIMTVSTHPAISKIVVTAKTSADKTTITWNEAGGSYTLGKATLTIDGKAVSVTQKSTGKTTATFSYAGVLKAGKHTYTITGTDSKGQKSSYTDTFTVAATTPVISKVSAKATTSDKATTISWTVADIDGVGKVQVSIDGGAAITIARKSGSTTSANFVYSGMLTAGPHTYKITAVDATGKAATPYSGSLKVTATTPTIKNAKVTAKTSGDNTVIAWTVYDYDKVKSTTLKIDGIKMTSGITQSGSVETINYTYAGKLTAGKHTYTIDAADAAVVPAFAKQTKGSFTVAATVPTISGVKITATTVKTTIAWNAYDIDRISGYKLTIDGKTITSGIAASGSGTTFAYTYTGVLKAGSHSYAITATDSQKKSSTASGKFTVTVASSAASAVFATAGITAKSDWLIDYDSILSTDEDDIVDAVFA